LQPLGICLLAGEGETVTGDDELICVHSCQGWHLAQVFKSKLEAAGIPVLLKYDAASLVYGITVDGLGRVRILVPQSYAADAEELLTEHGGALQDPSDSPDLDEGQDVQ
jgi:hypothetical protein